MAAGQSSKRTNRCWQGILRSGLRTGTLVSLQYFIVQNKLQGHPRYRKWGKYIAPLEGRSCKATLQIMWIQEGVETLGPFCKQTSKSSLFLLLSVNKVIFSSWLIYAQVLSWWASWLQWQIHNGLFVMFKRCIMKEPVIRVVTTADVLSGKAVSTLICAGPKLTIWDLWNPCQRSLASWARYQGMGSPKCYYRMDTFSTVSDKKQGRLSFSFRNTYSQLSLLPNN